jgi:glyoxalase family protein
MTTPSAAPESTRSSVHGIHHVTAIAGDPQENLDFYVGVMGLRLVKKSVNQDATNTYHFFYADAVGTPGTDLTFFPWPDMSPGQAGVGLAMEVSFSVTSGSLGYWKERLAKLGVEIDGTEKRFGEDAITFRDPHGLRLAIVETASPREVVLWSDSAVPEERQLRGMHSVRLWERSAGATAALLTECLGFAPAGEEEGWVRYGVDGGGAGKVVDVKAMPGERRGMWGAGSIHHVAWRTKDVDEEMRIRAGVEASGLRPTPLIDRFWFQSVYFKEPGGVLFELATDGPGFERDESLERLGEKLILPPWLEPQRAFIEASLPPVVTPRPAARRG